MLVSKINKQEYGLVNKEHGSAPKCLQLFE